MALGRGDVAGDARQRQKRVEQVVVTVADYGLTPMPATVQVTYEDGRTAEQTVPVDVWLAGERETTLVFESGDVARVEIDPGQFFPDVDRENNVWPPVGERN